ncbi:MAG: CPBP family intramembrane metalloprotease [Candidatus Methanophagaceae archaeon]|nr:MAG: CPBP family intramembrane metalloprotease [Methanophagales archaeon]
MKKEFIYLFLITAAEGITALLKSDWGLFCHGLLLFTLLGHAAFSYPTDKNSSHLLTSLALVPLIRILTLYAPLYLFHFVQWFFLLSIPLFFASAILIFSQHLNEKDVGLVLKLRQIPSQLAISFTGVPFGVVEYLILEPGPLLEELSFRSLFAPVVIFMVCTGFIEELLFRGIIQHNATKYFSPARHTGILFTTTLFAVMHIGNLSPLDVVFVFLIGCFYAYIKEFTGSIIGVSISHGMTNVVLFLLMPLLWRV